jgi:hypothetical protein
MAKVIALDANLIILLVVGLTNESYVEKHKRLKAFMIADYKLLVETIKTASHIVVTPNALSEASNLLRQISDPAKSEIAAVFKHLVKGTKEIFVTSVSATERDEFVRLGLSDSALLEVAKDSVVILSTDLDLCVAAEMAGYDAVNFNHLRDL